MAADMQPSRALLWGNFMAAAIVSCGGDTAEAASTADQALKEFDKRWKWYSGGFGRFWQDREHTDGKT